MNELEEKAIRQIIELADKVGNMVSELAVKTINGKEIKIDVQKDIYPIGSVARDLQRWAEAIIKNKTK